MVEHTIDPHITNSLYLKFTLVANESADNESVGVNNIFVCMDTCYEYCATCIVGECLTCDTGYILHEKFCIIKCPDGKYLI